MSKIMDIKSFQYIPVFNVSNSLYQKLSQKFRVGVGVNGNDGFYNVINSGQKTDISTVILRLLVDKYYYKSTQIIFK